jgi:hypothetical protein
MPKPRFSLAYKDEALLELVGGTDHKSLAHWAIECVERVLPYFERHHPDDPRPRHALEVLRAWLATGVFRMAEIRAASLAAHAAAREVGLDDAARSAARAAGQAVATAHVPAHCVGAARYAQQAVSRAAADADASAAVIRERDWQYQRLMELGGNQ